MDPLNDLEQAVLAKMLAGPDPVLAGLRAQAERASVRSRQLTGVGFFCDLEVPTDVPSLEGGGNFVVTDVEAELEGLDHGAGFALFIRQGRIDVLEAFTYDEPWPQEITTFTLSYLEEPRHLSLHEVAESPSTDRAK